MLKFNQTRDLLLYYIYWFFADTQSAEDVEPEIIKSMIEAEASLTFLNNAIEALLKDNLIEVVGVLPRTISITSKRLSYIDEKIEDPNSFLFNRFPEFSDPYSEPIPAADRFVTIDHNRSEYKTAVDLGERLIDAVQKSNAYAEEDREDQQRRLSELEVGYGLLRSNRINPNTAKMVLYGTLGYLAAKFADGPIGELARAAWEALKGLLGLYA